MTKSKNSLASLCCIFLHCCCVVTSQSDGSASSGFTSLPPAPGRSTNSLQPTDNDTLNGRRSNYSTVDAKTNAATAFHGKDITYIVDENEEDEDEQEQEQEQGVVGFELDDVTNSSLTVHVIVAQPQLDNKTQQLQDANVQQQQQQQRPELHDQQNIDSDIYYTDSDNNDYNAAGTGVDDYYGNALDSGSEYRPAPDNDQLLQHRASGNDSMSTNHAAAFSTEEIGGGDAVLRGSGTWNGVVAVNDEAWSGGRTQGDGGYNENASTTGNLSDSSASRNQRPDSLFDSDAERGDASDAYVPRWLEHNGFSSIVIYTWLAIGSASIVVLLIMLRYRHEVSTAVHYVRSGYSQARQHHTVEESNDLLSNVQI